MPDRVRESSSDSAGAVSGARSGELGKAYNSMPSWLRFLAPAVIGLASDLWLKAWSFPGGVPQAPPAGFPPLPAGRQPGDPLGLVDHILGFQTTVNYGAVFGMWQGMAFYFLLFSVFAMGLILWVFLTSRSSHWVVHIALGMITAGALGNLYDRAMFNGVRDMLRLMCFHFHPVRIFGYVYPSGGPIAADGTADWYPFIFNVADVMLCVGVPLLMLRWLMVKDGPGAAGRSAKAE